MAGRPPEADTVLRTGEFEILSATVGAFRKYILRGRFNDDMLGALQKQVLIPTQNMAVDAGGLSGITMALARSVYYTFQAMRGQGLALVLLNPPDSLRGFLKLLGADQRVPILLSESQLPARATDAAQAAEKLEKELQAFKRELEGNNLWQYVDREFCWVCPFCGGVREEVRISSRLAVPQGALEKVWRHLNFDCRRYVPAQPRYLTREELEAKARKASQEKLAAAREHVEALQSKVVNLQEKAQWADQVQKGVKIAASRQRKLLPTKAPEIPGCEVSFTYRSCDEVSGDFYDFVEMDDRRTAFVIGDVSGHGIEAGILMGMTKKVLSIRLAELGDPVAAMRKANADILKDLDRSSFVTAAAIVYDRVSRKLTCARAGHNPPLLYNPARGADCKRFELGGLMLGMAAPKVFDAQMTGETVMVQPGDALLLYTDGLEEGKDRGGQEFGVQRIVAALQAEHSKPGQYLLGALFYEFDRFSSGVPQEDDLTAVCVKFK